MKQKNRWVREISQLCGVVSLDDGVDPRYWNKEASQKSTIRKTDQLCCEAKRVLSLVLGGEINDPRLKHLEVIDVSFEEKGKQLIIWIMRSDEEMEISVVEVMSGLNQAQGYFRSIIAQSIERKRVPHLRFRYINNSEVGDENANSKNHK